MYRNQHQGVANATLAQTPSAAPYLSKTSATSTLHHCRPLPALGLAALLLLSFTTVALARGWQELGPIHTSWFEGGMGRLNCVAAHPTDASRMYVGSASGGLWVTYDGGISWAPLTDQLPVLGVSSVVVDYSNPNTIYLGTGDVDNQDTASVGVMKSTDGGATWNPTGLTFTLDNPKFVVKLLQHPTRPSYLLAATTDGIYRTENGGVSWEQVTPGGLTVWWDLAFQPGNPSVVYAVAQQGYFYRSSDSGTNWSPVTAGLPSPAAVDRAKLAVSPANPLGVYMVCDDTTYYAFSGLYRSLDGGSTFSVRSTSNPGFGYYLGWYHMAIAASPTNFTEVYVGGEDLTKSIDGGATWTNVSETGVTHVDCHALTYLFGALYACTDGGLHKTVNSAASWVDLSSALGIQQVYAMDNAVLNPSLFYIGTRDNGLNHYDSGNWVQGPYGDWESVVLDPTDPQTVYGTFNGTFYKITPTSFLQLVPTGNPNDYIQPLAIDPVNHLTVYAGNINVWRSVNGGTNWQAFSAFGDNFWNTAQISVAPSNPGYIYALRGGMVWRTTDGGAHWGNQTNGLPLHSYYNYMTGTFIPQGGAVWLTISSTDPNKLWLAQNEASTTNKVYASADGGASWTPYSGTLPNTQVNCIVYEPGSNDGLYLGFEAGVYYRNASLGDWQAFNTGLPNARVSQLTVQSAAQKVRAATFGRGVWQSDLWTPGPTVTTLAATAVTSATATLNGSANPTGAAASGFFQWGATTNYGQATPSVSLGSGTSAVAFNAGLSGLTPNQTYHFRAAASNSAAVAYGQDMTFTTASVTNPVAGGYSLSFNGVDGYVQVPHTNALNLFPLTITAWVKTTNQNPSAGLGVVNKYVAASFNGYNLFLSGGHVRAWYIIDGSSNVFGGGNGLDGGPIADGLWHHLAFTVDATGGLLYVDGIVKQALAWTGTPGAPTTIEPLRFGLYPGVVGSSNYFDGLLDEVQLWSVARSQAQIQASMYLPLTGAEPGLAAYYRFDESPGTPTTADLAVNIAGVNTGYLSNGVTRVAAKGVIHLETPVLGAGQVRLNFDIPFGLPGAFTLQNAGTIPGAWSDVPGAVLTTNLPGASFRFTTSTVGQQSYYRIKAQ
jgi:photosystem II stability/assembly factor-like uncharacterized protein